MAIPTTAPNASAFAVYRITALHVSRSPLDPAKMRSVAAAMNADTTNQFQLLHASGNVLIYDYAPRKDLNPNGAINLKNVISWEGVTFEALSVEKNRVVI